jgi:hypothetical protein
MIIETELIVIAESFLLFFLVLSCRNELGEKAALFMKRGKLMRVIEVKNSKRIHYTLAPLKDNNTITLGKDKTEYTIDPQNVAFDERDKIPAVVVREGERKTIDPFTFTGVQLSTNFMKTLLWSWYNAGKLDAMKEENRIFILLLAAVVLGCLSVALSWFAFQNTDQIMVVLTNLRNTLPALVKPG